MTINSDFGVTMDIKKMFFNRKRLTNRADRATVRTLGQVGAFIRRRARSSLRRRKRTSAIGTPPSVHSRNSVANLKNILFGLGGDRRSVLIGPVKLNQREESWIDLGPTTVPQLHEFGDVIRIHEWSWDGGETWRRRDNRVRHASRHRKEVYHFLTRTRRAVYRPRPFMGPAGEKELAQGKMADEWARQFRRAA